MNFLKAKTTWSNIEFAPFKLCVASAYVLIGAYFKSYVDAYFYPILGVFIFATVFTLYLWLKKMKAEN